MATPIEMPKLGNTVEECLLAKWIKKPGDPVASGEILAEIETDKATFEVAASAGGVLLDAFFPEGALVPVYTNICVIGQPGESVDRFRPSKEAPGREPEEGSAARRPAPDAPAARQAPSAPEARVALSPRARRFAAERNFDPPSVAGSGPGGRVLESDVRDFYHSSARVSSLASSLLESGYEIRGEGSGPGGMILASDLGEPGVPLSSVRGRIARRMRESLALTAQYTLHTSADATGLLALRGRVKAAHQSGLEIQDINIGDMVIFATVQALQDVPALNVEFLDGKLYQRSGIHIAFACDTPKGLLAPVVRDSQKLSLEELSARIKALTTQALEGTLAPDDMSGGTFTVSNLGSFGIESFKPNQNPPQVAILGVDAIQLKPVRRNGAVEFIDSIGLSLTLDHQVIDGAPGARFLQALRKRVEHVGEVLCTI